MSTNYYNEGIERITEQMLEQEVLNDIIDIRSDAIKYVKNTNTETNKNITEISSNAIDEMNAIKDKYLEYYATEKADMVRKLGESGIRKDLNAIDAATTKIYQDTVSLAGDTVDVIEDDIMTMIADKGYVMTFTNDGDGNVTATLMRGDE